MNVEKVLIVEDDVDINNLIRMTLERNGYAVIQAFSGSEAQLRLQLEPFNIVLVDLMLPGVNGEQLVTEIREQWELPIIVISAKSALEDKVNLFNLGADDYITKPFQCEELVARVHSHLRRSRNAQTDASIKAQSGYAFKALTLEIDAREVKLNNQIVNLTAHEFDILAILIQSPNKVYSRKTLYTHVWKSGYYGEDNSVNVHISNIRKKLKEVSADEEYIKTVWGIGFKMHTE